MLPRSHSGVGMNWGNKRERPKAERLAPPVSRPSQFTPYTAESTGSSADEHDFVSDVHGDVEPTEPAAGEIRVYDGSRWVAVGIGVEGDQFTVGPDGMPVWSEPSGGKSYLGAWAKGDISTIGTSDFQLFACHSKDANDEMPVLPPAGVVTDLTFVLNGDVGGVGDNLVVTLYKNGVATVLAATITGGAGTEYKGSASGSVSFSLLDELTVYAREVGNCSARRVSAFLWGRI